MKNKRKTSNLHKIVLIFTIILVVLTTVGISYYALNKFEHKLIPEMDKKARVVGESINSLISRSIDYGIPFQSLKKVNDFLASVLKDNPEIKYAAVTDNEGQVLYHSGVNLDSVKKYFRDRSVLSESKSVLTGEFYNTYMPILNTEKLNIGALHLGVEKKFVQNKLQEILYDVLTLVVVSILIVFELVFFLITFTVSGPIISLKEVMGRTIKGDFSQYLDSRSKDEIGRFVTKYNSVIFKINEYYHELRNRYSNLKEKLGEQVRLKNPLEAVEKSYQFGSVEKPNNFFINFLIYIRPALFLLIFSESLSISFFPMYVDTLYEPMAGLSKEIIIGLPISIFMLFWALSLPSAGMWSDRIGRRKPFIIGAVTTTVGLILTGMATSIYDLLAWRSITAVGYGIVFITCQGYITDNTSAKNRGKGMAMFMAGFFAGSLSGAAIGGILAGNIGYQYTFFLSGGLSVIAAFFVYYFLRDHQSHHQTGVKKSVRLKDFALLFSNKRFLTVSLLSAIPAKISLVGFLYYAVPIYLKGLELSQSSIGRMLMVYGLAIIIISPLSAKISDSLGNRKPFVVFGSILSGLGLLVILWWQSVIGIFVSIAMVGIGHAIGVTSQLALVTEYCQKEGEDIGMGTVMGIFRLLERVGNISGPVIIGILFAFYGGATSEGIPKSIAVIGLVTLFGGVLLLILLTLYDLKDKAKSDAIKGVS